ncbi:hypothetical protein N7454_010719 [Penicillium verhagenii]|nr:hypothetical protein N7454_010719 [Penicillium verhagenii]
MATTFHPDDSELRLLSSVASTSVDATNQISSPCLKGWPRQSARLKNNASSDKLATSVDLILACVPLAFLVFAILAIRLNAEEISSYGERILQTAKLSTSIFPIVFTAIVGNMLRNYALWRAEHCAPLGLLEQLNGSMSMTGAVTSMLAIGYVRPLTIAILLLWVMSPIGGQSALRMLTLTATSVQGNMSVEYLNIVNASSWFDGSSSTSSTIGVVDSIYATSLMATKAVQNSPGIHDDQTVYSSLVGLVVGGIPSDSEAVFSVETSYYDLDCRTKAQNVSKDSLFTEMGKSLLIHNATNLFQPPNSPFSAPDDGGYSFFIDTSYNFSASRQAQPQINLWYGTESNMQDGSPIVTASLYNCTLSTIRVEAWISCQNASCAVDRMRRSERDTRPDSITPFNDGDINGNSWVSLSWLLIEFPISTGYTHPTQAQATDNYIYGQYPVFNDMDGIHNWSTVSDQAVSSRFTRAFNTFWQASVSPYTIGSTLPVQAANTSVVDRELAFFNMTTATTFKSITVYQIEWGWTITFILAITLLQLCAVFGLFLKFQIFAPNILGFVSSMTRDNPHTYLPSGGSSLSGAERAKLLRDLPVQILDVDGQNDTGYIVLGSTTERKLAYQRLNKQRRYR